MKREQRWEKGVGGYVKGNDSLRITAPLVSFLHSWRLDGCVCIVHSSFGMKPLHFSDRTDLRTVLVPSKALTRWDFIFQKHLRFREWWNVQRCRGHAQDSLRIMATLIPFLHLWRLDGCMCIVHSSFGMMPLHSSDRTDLRTVLVPSKARTRWDCSQSHLCLRDWWNVQR